MFLQISPSDISTSVETLIINKAEIISITLIAFFLGLFLIYKILKAKKPSLISEAIAIWNFIWAVIKKDLRIY